MAEDFDFVSATDKVALLAFSTPEWLDATKAAAQQLGYKVHTAATHTDFILRFTQIRYQLVVVEELFAANSIEENTTLATLQNLPMSQRRHATVVLLGESFQTFTPMQAFKNSVNSVINASELFLLGQLLEKAVGDNEFFYSSFRDSQANLYKASRN